MFCYLQQSGHSDERKILIDFDPKNKKNETKRNLNPIKTNFK